MSNRRTSLLALCTALSALSSWLPACSSDSGGEPGGPAAGGSNASGSSGQSGASAGPGGAAGVSGTAGAGGTSAGAGGANAGGANAGASGASVGGAAGVNAGGATSGAAGAGASGSSGQTTGGTSGAAGTTGGAAGTSTAGAAGSAVNHGPVTGLVMLPGASTIAVTDSGSTPVQFTAFELYEDGTTGNAIENATWTIKPGDVATVTSSGLATATGSRAGEATVTAELNGLSASAELTVTLTQSAVGGGITPEDQTALDGATTADGAPWLYPYDQTVFPRGLPTPELMWGNGQAGDKVLVQVQSTFATIKAYAVTTEAGRVSLPQDLWAKLTESGVGGPAKLTVSRLPAGGGAATVLTTQMWTIGSGSLRGTVYYWAINTGRVMRIKPGATAPDDFFGGSPTTCPSCHTVAPNGGTLVMNTGTWPDETSVSYDLVSGQTLYSGLFSGGGGASRWAQAGVSADGAVLVQNFSPLRGGIGVDTGAFDAKTSAHIADSGLDGRPLHMPAFSPDDRLLTFVDSSNLGNSLHVMDWDPAARKATNDRVLVTTPGSMIQFPTVSPDHKWVAYQKGNALGSQGSTGDLFLASVETPGVEIPLTGLNGTNYLNAGRDLLLNYEPTFAPLAAGGYYWLVFHSRRTYGNRLTGPAFVQEAVGVKQLWVAAINQNPQAGQDPSHPAFWVPGQDISTLNMRGYWAFDPCKGDGTSCGGASECCNGACTGGVCGSPPGQTCKPVGGTCADASECCYASAGYQCINSHCTEAKP